VATAGALSAAAFAATVALGATFGLYGVTQPDSPVGRLDDRHAVAVVAGAGGGGRSASPVVVTTPAVDADADD